MATKPKKSTAGVRRKRYKRPPRMRRNPHIFGMISGLVAATFLLCLALYRQAQGIEHNIPRVLIGAAFAFVVSYALTGLFALFLIRIAEHELKPAARGRSPKKPASPEAATEPAAPAGESQT